MFLSIVIPVYNASKTIVRCLDSIWRSGLDEREFEVVCVNDCSSDNTLEVLQEIQREHRNLKVVTNAENVRAGGSRNHGVRVALGDYICFIDADDYYHPGSLKAAFETAVNEGLDILFCDSCRELEGGKPSGMVHNINNTEVKTGVDFFENYPTPLAPWKYIFKRSLMVDNNIFFEEKVIAEDSDWVSRITIAAKKMRYMPIILVHYVLMDDSLSGNMSFAQAEAALKAAKRLSALYKEENISKFLRIANEMANAGLKRYFICYAPVKIKAKAIKENLDNNFYRGKAQLALKFPILYSLISNITTPFMVIGLKFKRKLKGRL